MRPPDVEDRSGSDATANSSAFHRLHPGRHSLRFAVTVAAGWALIVAVLATVARLTTSGEMRPGWGEVVGVSIVNGVMVFVAALAAGLIVRLAIRLRGTDRQVAGVAAAPGGGIWAWTVRGRAVAPTTTEGRFAVLAALLGWVPFFAGPALFATPILLILALRRGDRAWSLLLPALATLFLVAFLTAEFVVGHR